MLSHMHAVRPPDDEFGLPPRRHDGRAMPGVPQSRRGHAAHLTEERPAAATIARARPRVILDRDRRWRCRSDRSSHSCQPSPISGTQIASLNLPATTYRSSLEDEAFHRPRSRRRHHTRMTGIRQCTSDRLEAVSRETL